MDHFLTEEQQMIKELTRKIAEERIKPVREELDEQEKFPWEIVQELGKADLFRVFLPEEYGGTGGGLMELGVVGEELARVCSGVATTFGVSSLGSFPILLAGTEEQKQKYLPPIAAGERLPAFALTEAEAGSDASNIQTTAVLDGDGYIINGTKQFITNAGEGEIYTVFASIDRSRGVRGLAAFIVEKDTPGFSFGRKEKKMGHRCSSTRELIFEDCRIPKENLLGEEGDGFKVAMKTLDKSRPMIGALAVGIAQGAYEAAAEYASQRVQFGKPIISFQGVSFLLADMATEIEAARALVYSVCRWIDSGAKDISRACAMAKLFSSDMAMRVTTNAVQILGGYGYMRDYPVEKMMRDAKLTQIYEGTNQIQRLVIASRIIKEYASQ
ncbi:acyl-CoA dehydrogenase [candidate division TA06 bacterium SM1_40]|uniref:Acyl-CoA dehydrogenase n=2 Tax=Bacteria division TA06 TaxID=1156500 RepID=A0A0S8JM65_UNCT6|nr:MAG: acyl-CoA dehydrogenase [candidate division TA06 bacterium SM23_40]KPL09893.1 MAG: acyl-CoA dehydrogenase [candidate division TA06 bacterium SM1_40]